MGSIGAHARLDQMLAECNETLGDTRNPEELALMIFAVNATLTDVALIHVTDCPAHELVFTKSIVMLVAIAERLVGKGD